ncbi:MULTISPECIES: H-NS histone family protein, partial [Stenotrophomonas]
KVAPKYRNPANSEETWTGRGRQPKWMALLVAKGALPQDFLIS